MHLTPEQRAIGKENFNAAIGSELIRRDFLRKSNAEQLQSGAGLGSYYFGYGTVEKPVRVAVLGTGDEGSILIGAINPKYVSVCAIADIRPYNQFRAFYGDNYSEDIKKLRTGLIEKYGWKDEAEARKNVRVYGDFNELLAKEAENTDPETRIEAVIIGLPLHLHAPAAVAAMKAGFHVLTEKLMGHTIANCKEMGRAADLYKKHLATGHQRHYNILYDHTVNLMKSGVLGDLHYIRAQWHRNNQPGNDSWQQPIPSKIKAEDGKQSKRLEKDLANWKKAREAVKNDAKKPAAIKTKELALWDIKIAQKEAQLQDEILVSGGAAQGFTFKSAKDYGYKDAKLNIEGTNVPYDRPAGEELIRWRLFDRTSAGLMAELGSHQLDAASIFIASMFGGKKQHPLSVSATATRSLFPRDLEGSPLDRDADDHIHCLFEYKGPNYNGEDELGRQRRITVAYSSINGNGFGGYGETVFGTKGTLVLETEKEAMLYKLAEVNSKAKIVKKPDETLDIALDDEGDALSAAIGLQAIYGDISRGYCEEIEHWAYCIRENPDCSDPKLVSRCHPAVALGDAVIALTTNIAAKKGCVVAFNENWFDINSDDTPEREFAETDEQKKHFTPNLERYGA